MIVNHHPAEKTGTILLLLLIFLSGLATCGCLGGSQNSPGVPDTTAGPTNEVSPVANQILAPTPEITLTPTPALDSPGPAVVNTVTGYILTDTPGAEDTVQVQLKAGKANFHIRLPEYALGDSYTLTLTNAEGPFTYRSSHEFSGISGAGDISIVKTIPRDGTYQVSLDYGGSWEIEVTQ